MKTRKCLLNLALMEIFALASCDGSKAPSTRLMLTTQK